MLDHTNAFGSFSVNDLEAAKKFYGNTLGLKTEVHTMCDQQVLGLHFDNGTEMMIYPKPEHEPSTYTVLNFKVKDVRAEVAELKKKGIRFEHYEGNDKEEINADGGLEKAWFRDPAGNFLSIVQEQ